VRSALETVNDATPPAVAAHLTVTEAELHSAFGLYKTALPAAERAVALATDLDDALAMARAQHAAGGTLAALGRSDEGEALLRDALATAQRLRNRRLVAMLLGELGTARSRRGDVVGARAFYAQALANYQAIGVQRQAASVAGHLAEVEFAGGDAETALSRAEEALAAHRALGSERSVANDLANMAAYLVALARFEEAWARALQALSLSRDMQAPIFILWSLQHLAAVAALRPKADAETADRDVEHAARLMGYVDARVAALDLVRDYTEHQEYERIVGALDEALSAEAFDALIAEGRAWSEDVAVAEASKP
jgi:hypothetical protein